MGANELIDQLRHGDNVIWPKDANSEDFAKSLDRNTSSFRDEFKIPTKAHLKRKSLADNAATKAEASDPTDSSIYFCGNSLGLQPKAVSEYLSAYLQTWSSIAVGGHFTQLEDSPLTPYQDMAADCARKSAAIVGASPEEIVVMNTLTVNLHLMMARFYKPSGKKNKIMLEWRPFPSDYYAIESQIEWHGLNPEECMLKVSPDHGYLITTQKILSLIDQHASDLALILLPGIQYYTGQLLDIPIITAHAHKHNITIGWDLAHAAGNVPLQLHDWDVDFACWCTYKYVNLHGRRHTASTWYMNAGAGAIAGCFVHERHGDNVKGQPGLKGWYGHEKASRFKMDNEFVPTKGAQGFQVSNPSVVDLTCLSAALSVFEKTSMEELRGKSLLLTAYAEFLLSDIAARWSRDGDPLFEIITPPDPLARGAQLSVLLKEELMEDVSKALEGAGIVCDKRKPGCIRVAPVPLYNTFGDVWRFMQVFEEAVRPQGAEVAEPRSRVASNVEARL